MFKNSSDQAVLDTLKFTNQKIFLKELHAERSFEALQLLNTQIDRIAIFEIYDQIESEFGLKLKSLEMLRLIFRNTKLLTYEAQVVSKTLWPQWPQLQLMVEPKQVSGLGYPNYKWVQREFWTDILKQKNQLAHDVICMNEHHQITETSRCNLFFYDAKTDIVFTPFLQTGCINGVYRRFVMQTHQIQLPDRGFKQVIEFDIDYKKIAAYEIYVANSVREVVKTELFFEK
jgi:branched-subunit amino acid aminotransferase/4-amino-4-deoxychorismate lyase